MSAPTPHRLPQRRVGPTDVTVSVLGLGTAPLGGLYRVSSDATAQATVDQARALGITYFDTAPQYGRGLAERRLGQAVRSSASSDIAISTKVGRVLEPATNPEPLDLWPEALPFDTRYDASAEGIARSLRDSLDRLERDSLDILLLHDPEHYAADEHDLVRLLSEAHSGMAALRAEGRIKAIGLGVNAPGPCRLALDLGEWDCMMLAGTYSVLEQNDGGLLDLCLARNVSVFVAGPYMSGALAGGGHWKYGDIPADVAARISVLNEICARHQVPIEALALQFPLAHPAVATVVTGMRSPAEVTQNLAHLTHAIPKACWDEVAANGFIEAT